MELAHVHLLASGPILYQAVAAQEQLVAVSIGVTVWSVTSFNELEKNATECAQANRQNPWDSPHQPFIAEALKSTNGVYVAATDYMKKFALGLSQWIPGWYEVLGTDGYGLSESRARLREHFEVDASAITRAALVGLYRDEQLDAQHLEQLINQMDVHT